MPPLLSNTLDEAACWLSEISGEAWTARRILSAVLASYETPDPVSPPATCLRCAPPLSTKYGLYKLDPEKGTPSNPFVHVCDLSRARVHLYPIHVADLLDHGETFLSIAERPDSSYRQAGEYVLIEPIDQAFRADLSMVRISGSDLVGLAARLFPAKPTTTEPKPQEDEATPTAEASQPGANQSTGEKLTGDQREQLVKRANNGETHTALANEFNVSRQYVSKLCKEAKENSRPSNWAFGKK